MSEIEEAGPQKHIRYFLECEPVTQGRPRFTTKGGFVHAYDPEKSRTFKEFVNAKLKNEMRRLKIKPFTKALSVELAFMLRRPKSVSKKVNFHTKTPDVDNLAKAVKDGLKGACWIDDKQVVDLIASKEYTDKTPGVDIIINELED